MAKYIPSGIYNKDIYIVKLIYSRVYTPWRHTQGRDIYTAEHKHKSNIYIMETYMVLNVYRVEYTYGVYIWRSIYMVVYEYGKIYIWEEYLYRRTNMRKDIYMEKIYI